MSKFLQTITIFALVSAMMVFIFSALRPEQYLAEMKFLVIANNLNSTCNHQLGETLVGIIESDTFRQNLRNKNYSEGSMFSAKKYNNSDIVKIKVEGNSLFEAQSLSEKIKQEIVLQAKKYYPKEDNIKVKILTDAKIVRTPKVILENSLKGFVIGIAIGLVIVISTKFRLDIFRTEKSNGEIVLKKKIKPKQVKNIRRNKKDEDYTRIIKKRLETELAKKTIGELDLSGSDYVFSTITKKESKMLPEAKIIAATTMMVGKQTKQIVEDKAPENLPIFIEEKLPKNKKDKEHGLITENVSFKKGSENIEKEQNVDQESKTHQGDIDEKGIDGEEKIATDNASSEGNNNVKQINKQDETNIRTKKKSQKDISTVQGAKMTIKKISTGKVPGAKKASAHDIANGFAPANSKNSDNPSNEEIKDRLNKLLRGEL